MKTFLLTDLLHQADRKMVQDAVVHLQEKFAFRNAEFLKLKSEKEKSEQQYQNLSRTHQELLREYEHLQEVHQKRMREYQASGDKFNKELSELKKEIRKKDQLLEEKQRQFEQTQKELYETGRLLQESRQKEEEYINLSQKNGLMWAPQDNGADIDWQLSQKYCKYYQGNGYHDWRLPTVSELEILYKDMERRNFYITITGNRLWSSDGSTLLNIKNGNRERSSSKITGYRALPIRNALSHEIKRVYSVFQKKQASGTRSPLHYP